MISTILPFHPLRVAWPKYGETKSIIRHGFPVAWLNKEITPGFLFGEKRMKEFSLFSLMAKTAKPFTIGVYPNNN